MRRELFDNVLFQHARSLSAVTVVEGFTFSDFLYDGGHIAGLVGTDDQGRQRRYGASIVIGADGAMSRVAEMAGAYDFGHKHHQHWIAAFRIYFRGVGGRPTPWRSIFSTSCCRDTSGSFRWAPA